MYSIKNLDLNHPCIMKKSKDLLENLYEEYFSKIRKTNDPEIFLKAISEESSEGFSCSYLGAGIIHLTAHNACCAAFGLNQIITGIKSGHLAEFLGKFSPRFNLRPLWIGCHKNCQISPAIAIQLPDFWDKDCENEDSKLNHFCKRVIELGYNAVMIGRRDLFVPTEIQVELETFLKGLKVFREYGLKIILKPDFEINDRSIVRSPLNPEYIKAIEMLISQFTNQVQDYDFLFWEGGFSHFNFFAYQAAEEYTLFELVVEEVRMIEKFLKNKTGLIYYVPTHDVHDGKKYAEWMPALCDEVSNFTTLAFSAVAGDPCLDHLEPHPFWEKLRQRPDVSATPLLPILNIGGVRQGEGLWPSIALDLIENYIGRCFRHSFAGIIGLVNHLPRKEGLLDCSLWVASSYMWNQHPPQLLAHTWFLTHKPDLDFLNHSVSMAQLRKIIIALSLLRSLTNEKSRDTISSEECRLMTESLLSQLKELRLKFSQEKNNKKGSQTSFSDYFNYFIRDARRIILHFLQCFNIPLANILEGDDLQEAFWTSISQAGHGDGFRTGNKVAFLDAPNPGAINSRMSLIFDESRLFGPL